MVKRVLSLPLYMRLGDRGAEQLVGRVTWDPADGESEVDLEHMEGGYVRMLRASPELREAGIEIEDGAG
ncbi:hypothetical protein ACIQNG_25665 [Streptomyces sp. NPDC091377]|uniref:hypothetical protein n=1 Tax=Streptomyces sp. NPDC091377 TaxID=3365995 RepID=UPI0037FF274A